MRKNVTPKNILPFSRCSYRKYAVFMAMTIGLSGGLWGCGSSTKMGDIGFVSGFAGAVVADEPRAVLAAQDVLSAGGNATDAAVSLYFSLAVTLPSTAGLGGGGSCIVKDGVTKKVEAIDFPAQPPLHAGMLAVALPASPRGIFALHTRHGSFRWESLLAAPEQMSREGVTVSRALSWDLFRAEEKLARDPDAKRLFFRPDGHVLTEGDRMTNFELGAVLSSLRRSPGDFYLGQFARDFASGASFMGASMNPDDLRDVKPALSAGTRMELGDELLVLPDGRKDAVALANWLRKLPLEQRGQALADTLMLPGSNSSPAPGTAFAVIDSKGGAVACALTSNGLFGTGRMVSGTGIFLAAQKPLKDKVAGVPAMIFNPNSNEIRFAGGAGGGVDPTAAVLEAALDSHDGELPVAKAVAASSVSAIPGAAARVNAMACQAGKLENARCEAAVAPAGAGYGVLVGNK